MTDPHQMARSGQWWNELASVAHLLEDPDPRASDSLFTVMHGHAIIQVDPATAALLERGDEAFERVLHEWWNTENDQLADQIWSGLVTLRMEGQAVGNILHRLRVQTSDDDVRDAASYFIDHHDFGEEDGLPAHVRPHKHPQRLSDVVTDSLEETLLAEISKGHDAEKTKVLVDALRHLPYGADLLAEQRQILAPKEPECP